MCACFLPWPTQANLKNPGLSLSPEEILQLAGSLQPAYATQEPENYNPEWPSCSPNPEPQTAHKGPEYLETNALLPGPINTCGTLTTTGTHQDIKPLKVANEWNPVSLEMSSTPLSQKTTPHLENEDGTNAEDDTRLAHQFGKNEDTRLPSADHPNGGAYEPAAPKRQAVHAQPDTPLKLPPNSTSPAADVAPGGVETEASGCDPNGIAAEGGPQQAGGVEQGAKGTVSENVRQATRPAADAAPDGAETEASGCKQNGVAADGGAQLTGAACSTGSTGCTQAGAELSSGSITLYGDATSSEALPIIALLSETATPYSLVSPELLEAEVSKLAITHKTSLGGPPVLDDDGYKVWGTTTILRYVCGKLDLDSWLPCDLETRGLCDNALEFWSSSFLDFANKVLYPAVGLMEPLSPEKAQSTQTSFTSDIWPAMQHLLNKGSGDVLGGKSANISDLCFVIYLELICAVLPDHYVSKHEGVKKYVSGVRHRVPAIQPLLKAAVDFHIKMKQKHDQDYQETARTEAIQTQVKGQAVTSVDPLAPMSTDQGQSSPRTESESTSPEGLPAPAAARRAAEERAAAEAAAAAVAKQAKLEAARREAEERETAEAAAENETSRREAEKRAAAEAAAAAVKQAKEEEAAETLRLEADGGAAPQGAETMNSLGGEMAATYTPTLAADAAVARMKAEKGVAAEISRSAEGRLRLADSIPAAAMPEGNNIPAAENGGSSREIQTLEECASLHAETSISSLNREGEWMMSLVSTGDQRVITDALANSSSPVSVAATEEFQDDKGDFEDIDGLADINDDVFDDDEDNDWTMKQQIRFAVAAGDWNEALQLSDMMESAQKCKEDIEEVMDEVQLRNLIQDALQAEDFEAVASLSRKMSAVKAEGQLREQVAEALKQGDWAQASRLSTQLARSSDSRRQDASSSRSLNLTPVAYGHALHPPPASSRPYHSAPRQRAVASWQENAPESKRAAQHADTRKSAALSSASHKPGHDLANKASQEGSAQVKRESEERAAAEAAAAAAAKQAEAEAVAEARREAEERAAAVAAVAAKQAEAEAAEAMKRGAEERATAAAAAAAELANEAARREAEERAAAVVAAAAKQAEEDATEAARREARERAAAEIAGACTSGLIRKVAEDLEAFGAREGEKKPTAAKAEVEPSEQAPAANPATSKRNEEQGAVARVSISKSVLIELTLDMCFQTVMDLRAAFSAELVQDLARALGTSPENIKVERIRAGSVIVDVTLEQGLFNVDTDDMVAFEMLIKQLYDSKSILKQGLHTRNVVAIRLMNATAAGPAAPADVATIFDAAGLEVNQVVEIAEDKKAIALLATMEDIAKAAACPPATTLAENDVHVLTEAEMKAKDFRKKMKEKRKSLVKSGSRTPSITHSAGSSVCDDDSQACSPGAAVGKSSKSGMVQVVVAKKEKEPRGKGSEKNLSANQIRDYTELEEPEHFDHEEGDRSDDNEMENDYTEEELQVMASKVWIWLRQIPHHSEFVQNSFVKPQKSSAPETQQEVVVGNVEQKLQTKTELESSQQWQVVRDQALLMVRGKIERDGIQEEPWMKQLRHEAIDFVHALEGDLKDLREDLGDDELATSDKYNPRSLFLLPLDSMFRRGIIAIVEQPFVNYFILFVILANVVTMALEDPLVSEQSEANRILGILSIVFIAIFALEAALKVIAYGVLLGPHAYLKNPWNCLDFFIVVTGLLDVLDAAVVGGESNRVFSSLRLLRPLRIIRAVEHFEELRVLVALILSCAAQMVHALGLVSVILLTFGIAGNLIWRGSLRGRCYHRVQGNIIANADEQICSITGETGLGKCPPEYQCIQLANNPFPGVVHFDNVYMSIISTFLLLSAQGWGELMWDLESGFAGASNPIVILLIFTGHLFLLKLILVVLTNKYAAVKLVKTNEFNSMSLFELRVGIIEAQDLPRMDLFGASDAYIQMQLGRKTKKTKVLKNTLHPRWYEHYVLPVEKTTSLLTLRMFDWNRIGAHDFMGQVVIPVGNCDEHESGSDRWYEMTEEDTGAACGIVRVQLQWRKSKKSVWSRLPTVQIECTESMEEFQAENVIMSSILKMFSRIASSQTLVFVMIGVVIMNVIVMGAEHECGEYSYCLDFQYVTEVLNVVFAIMFAIEMLIKIVGVGLVNYCKDSGNMVYVFVVAAGIAEIPFILMVLACLEEKRGTLTDAYACEANILGIVRLFRLVRLLRIGRLLEFFPQLNMQLTVMARTVKAVSSLIVLLAMIVAIFAILGSNLFASKSMEAIDSVNTEGDSNFARGSMVRFILPYSRRDPSWNRTLLTGRMMEANTTYEPHRFLVKQHGTDAQYWALLQYGITGDSGLNELSKTIHSPLIVGLVPRSNFDNFPNAVITTFQVLTLARWNQVWYSCTSSPGGAVPFIYFLCLIVIGNFFFFNLFTAIIIQAFAEQRQEMDEQIKEQLALESETEEAGNPDFTLRLSSGDIGALSRDTSSRFSSVVVTSFSSIINFFMRSRKVAPEGGGQVTQSESSKSSPESLGHDRAFVKLICTFFAVADNLILIIFQGLLVTHDAGLENQIIRISTTVCLGIGAVDLVRRCRTRQSITDSFNIMDAIVMLAALPELLFLWTDGQVLFAEAAFLFFRALRPLRVVLVLGNLRKFVRQIKDSAKPLRNAALIVFFGFLVMGIFGVTELAGKMNFCSDSLVHSRSQCIGFSDTGEARVWKKPALNYDWIGQAIATMFAIALRDRWTELMYQAVDTTGNRDEGQFRDYSPWYILLYFAVLFVGGFFLLNIFAGVVVDTHCLSLRKRKAKALQNHQIIAKIPDDGRQNAWLKMVNNWKIDIFMLCIIMLDIITMSCESYKASRSMIAFVSGANFFFTFVYAAEAQVKIYAMKAAKYFSNPWCRFEFAILLLTVWGVSVEKMDAFSDSVGGSDTIAPGLAAYFRIFRSVRVLRAFRLFNLQAAKSFRDLLSSLSNAAAQISEVFAILCIIYIIFGNVTVGIFGNMCDRSAPGGDPFISSESDAGLVPRCLLVDEDAKPPGIVVSNVGRALVTLLSISTADTWTRVLKYLSLSPGVRKSGENAVPQARIQLMRYLQTREINYLYEARALLPGCQAADELNALSDVVDCSSKAGHACMSTCGNMTIAYLLCNVFICLTTLIILNLLLAVLLESLQDHQETVASSNPNGTQDGGSVSRLINISRAASSWRRGSTATFVEAQHAQDDEDDDTPKFVGVSPLPRSRATQSPQRSPLGSPLPSPSKVDGFVRRLRGTAKMRSSIEDEFRGDSGGRSSVSSRGSVRMGQLPSPTK